MSGKPRADEVRKLCEELREEFVSGIANLLGRWHDTLSSGDRKGTDAIEAAALEVRHAQLKEALDAECAWLLEQAEIFRRNPQVCKTYCEVYARLMGLADEGEQLFTQLRGKE